MDTRDVLGQQLVLGTTGLEFAGGINDQDPIAMLRRLASAENENAGSEPGTVEKVRTETDNGLQQIHLQDRLSDFALFAHAEQGAVQEEVYARDGGGRQVLLLPEQPDLEAAVVLVALADMVDGFQQHAPGPQARS
jgi:hypothetical protein